MRYQTVPAFALDTVIDRPSAIEWAQKLLQDGDFVILDVETTGLSRTSEPVQVGILSSSGDTLLDTLCWPSTRYIPQEVVEVHGISAKTLQDRQAPTFDQVVPLIRAATDKWRVAAYNVSYDYDILSHAFSIIDEPWIENVWFDVMKPYSAYVGTRLLRRPGYKTQRLPRSETSHGAIADCRTTLKVIQTMARGNDYE